MKPALETGNLTPETDFYDRAYVRILRFMLVLAALGTVASLVRFGGLIAAGFLAGCAIALVNFHWLKRVVAALADRTTQSGERQRTRGVVLRFLLRYLLIGLGAYVIFRVSLASVYGLLAGLFLPVGAIACEAAYELYVALRRGA